MLSFSVSEIKGNLIFYDFLPKNIEIITIGCSVANTFLLTSSNSKKMKKKNK